MREVREIRIIHLSCIIIGKIVYSIIYNSINRGYILNSDRKCNKAAIGSEQDLYKDHCQDGNSELFLKKTEISGLH